MKVSVVIPAYNEEGIIGEVIRGIQDVETLSDCEILVVNDGSTDRTAEVAEKIGARVISHPYNIGNGAAIKSGIRNARGDVLVFMDADGQHDPKDIPRLLEYIDRYHMVVGSRSKESETQLLRDVANLCYNKLASWVAGMQIKDLTSGFRVMRAEDARRFCDILPNTFSYPTTSTLAFIRSGRSVKYVPITTKQRVGKSKINPLVDGPRFFLIIAKIATMFAPLKVFLPISFACFMSGLAWYCYTYFAWHTFTNMSALLLNTSVIVFMLGLISEQIASLRLEKIEPTGDYQHRSDRHSEETIIYSGSVDKSQSSALVPHEEALTSAGDQSGLTDVDMT